MIKEILWYSWSTPVQYWARCGPTTEILMAGISSWAVNSLQLELILSAQNKAWFGTLDIWIVWPIRHWSDDIQPSPCQHQDQIRNLIKKFRWISNSIEISLVGRAPGWSIANILDEIDYFIKGFHCTLESTQYMLALKYIELLASMLVHQW